MRPLRAGRKRWSVAVAVGVVGAVGNIIAALQRAYGHAADAVAAVAVVVAGVADVVLDVAATVVVVGVGVIVEEVVGTYVAVPELCALLDRRN